MKNKGFSLIELLIAVAICAIILGIAFKQYNGIGYNINPSDFYRSMAQEGIQNPQQGPYRYGACAESDTFNSTFTGVKNGIPVSGVVCAGWGGPYGKAMTVRYF